MKAMPTNLRDIVTPRPISAPRRCREPHTLYIEPNQRGGVSLRWKGDDEQIGNFATVADALRTAEFQFADLVIVQAGPPREALAPAHEPHVSAL